MMEHEDKFQSYGEIESNRRFGFGYGVPFFDCAGTAGEIDPNGICHFEAADGKSQTGHCQERSA